MFLYRGYKASGTPLSVDLYAYRCIEIERPPMEKKMENLELDTAIRSISILTQ
jgi:hypothetical protein